MAEGVPEKKTSEAPKSERVFSEFLDPYNVGGKLAEYFAAVKRIVALESIKKSPEILTIPDNAFETAIATQEILLGTNTSNILYYLDENLSVLAQYPYDFVAPKENRALALDKWHNKIREQIKVDNPKAIVDTDLGLPIPEITVSPYQRIMNAYE